MMTMRMMLKSIILTLSLMFTSATLADDFDDGMAAYDRQDYPTALRLWRSLAEQGDSKAQFVLGVIYESGQGVKQNYKAAAKWYRLAAEQGLVLAQNNLGGMYFKGQGVAQDYKAAIKWTTLASNQGYAGAQTNLGGMYENGQGVIQDNIKAHMWYNIGASNGSDDAGKNRDIVAAKMTPAQIEAAQALAQQCIQSNYKQCE